MPLRAAADFPPTPEPEALEATYRDCRAALVSANRSRGALKALSERRGVVITKLQRELAESWRRIWPMRPGPRRGSMPSTQSSAA